MQQDAETYTPGRGTPESAAWCRAKMLSLGETQAGLARLMIECGDDRKFDTITRSMGRMANGSARVSGEMRALLGTLEQVRRAGGNVQPDPAGD